ncbi:hypothetical protein Jiend_59690 [Micromonospora endophytica]|nr:hypothetical protein Jiend_59690 [Micromonospora endophytica]
MTGTEVTLPDGRRLRLTGGAGYPRPDGPPRSRIAYAAAHVVADPQADNTPGTPATLDWDRTLAFRHHLWSYGLGVAEAMDTAQRGMGLDYSATRELIRRSAAEARAAGGRIVAGVTTDQLPAGPASLPEVTAAYREQLDDVQAAGAVPVLMCSRHLAAAARVPEDYLRVYDELLTAADRPVVLHWLGPMFDPALTGYWGSTDLDLAADTVVELIKNHASRVDGIKMSLLDAGREVALRRRLPADVRLYTGDDFNYPELIRGDEQGHSDALLGSSPPSRRPPRRRWPPWTGTTWPPTTRSSRPPCRWPGTCSPPPPGTTRPASSSSPGSPATRTTSPWWAACSPAGHRRTWPPCSPWPTRPVCCPTPSWRRPGPGRSSPSRG